MSPLLWGLPGVAAPGVAITRRRRGSTAQFSDPRQEAGLGTRRLGTHQAPLARSGGPGDIFLQGLQRTPRSSLAVPHSGRGS